LWGTNSNGVFGDNTGTARSTLVSPLLTTDYKNIYLTNTSFFEKADGTLWGTGANNYGQLGVESTLTNISSPVQIINGKYGAAGLNAAAVIKNDGTLWSAGIGTAGELGRNSVLNSSSFVQESLGKTDWVKVGLNRNVALALDSAGRLWATGSNSYGQQGQNGGGSRSTYTQIGTSTNWIDFAIGDYTLAGLKNDGSVWAWGYNTTGVFGFNDKVDRSSPVQIGAGSIWTKVAIGSTVLLMLKSDGSIWGAGTNSDGRLGTGDKILRSSFTQMLGGPWKDFSISAQNTHMLSKSGQLWATGTSSAAALLGKTGTSSPQMLDSTYSWIKFGSRNLNVMGTYQSALASNGALPTPTPFVSPTPTPTP